MRLRVTHKHHTHAGKLYRVGEEFDGSERLLQAFGDRLERVADEPAADDVQGHIDALRAEAEALGVDVDGRWGEARLRKEIDAAKEGQG